VGALRRERVLVGAAGLATFMLFLLVRPSLTDDAYITLAYAKNLALHLHWGLIPQETANSATSPLNVALLAAVSVVTRISGDIHPVVALGVLLVGAGMVTAWGWTRVVRALDLPWGAAAIGVALALVDPFLLSAVGLEVMLIPALLVLLLAMALESRPAAFGVVAGLMLLTRLDLAVYVVIVGLGTAAIRRRWPRTLLVTAAVAGPWFVASWLFLGSAIPDTLVIKVGQVGGFFEHDYLTGPWDYVRGRPWDVTLAFVPAVLGLVATAAWLVAAPRRDATARARWAPVAAMGVGAAGYYVAYCLLGVPPYHWYYVPPIAGLSLVAVVLCAAWMRAPAVWAQRSSIAAVAPLGVLAALAVGGAAADLAQGVPWRSPVIFGNFASARDYARVGLALRDRVGPEGVASPGEIGTLAYFCECPILDEFSDRGRVVEIVESHLDHDNAVKRALIAVNYAWLDRDQKPRRPAYRLAFRRGPRAGRSSWTVWSAAYGVNHMKLVPQP
jgi:hypothetical protein